MPHDLECPFKTGPYVSCGEDLCPLWTAGEKCAILSISQALCDIAGELENLRRREQ